MSASIINLPDMALTFEGPKATKPGHEIPDEDKTFALRSGPLQALLQSTIDHANSLLGSAWKEPVRVVATSNITPAGLQTIDGVTLLHDDRVILVGNTDQTQNGIRLARSGSWSRPGDASTGARILGAVVQVLEGTLAGSTWKLDTLGPITIGATPLVWSPVGRPESVLSISGASATIDGSVGTYSCEHAAALTALTVGPSWPVGATRIVRKSNVANFGISVTPPLGCAFQGTPANTTVTLPGSSTSSSGASGDRADMWWAITRDSPTTFRFYGGHPQFVGGTIVGNDYLSAPGSAPSPAFRMGSGRGMYGDATKGVVLVDGSIDRLSTRSNGGVDVFSNGSSTEVLRMIASGLGTSWYVRGAAPEGSLTAAAGTLCFDYSLATPRLWWKRSGSGNTGWQEISPSEAGTWTATATLTTNLDSVVPSLGHWSRIRTPSADVVSFALRCALDATAIGGAEFELTTPVPTNFTGNRDLAGTIGGQAMGNAFCQANPTTDRIQCLATATTTSAQVACIQGMYLVLP